MSLQSSIEYITSQINSIKAEAQDALSRVESFASTPYQIWVDFPRMTTVDVTKPEPISRDDLPTMTRPSFPANVALEPAALDRYKEKIWLSPDLDALSAKLSEFIESGGTGIGADVQAAIFDADSERQTQALRDAMDMAGARSGAKGCRYPNSMTKAAQNELLQKWQFDQVNRSRDIVKLVADLAQKNVQFAISGGIDVEKLHADFAIRYAEIFRNVSAAAVDKFRAEVQAYVAEYDGQLRYVLANVEIAKSNANIEQDYQRLLVEKWSHETQAITQRGLANIQQAEQATQIKLEAVKALATETVGMMNTFQANSLAQLSGTEQ